MVDIYYVFFSEMRRRRMQEKKDERGFDPQKNERGEERAKKDVSTLI